MKVLFSQADSIFVELLPVTKDANNVFSLRLLDRVLSCLIAVVLIVVVPAWDEGHIGKECSSCC